MSQVYVSRFSYSQAHTLLESALVAISPPSEGPNKSIGWEKALGFSLAPLDSSLASAAAASCGYDPCGESSKKIRSGLVAFSEELAGAGLADASKKPRSSNRPLSSVVRNGTELLPKESRVAVSLRTPLEMVAAD